MAVVHRQKRVAWSITAALGLMLAVLAGRLVYICVASGEPLAERVAAQSYMRVPIRAERGHILDTRLRVLAGSTEVESVFADPKILEDRTAAAAAVAPILDRDPEAIYALLSENPDRRFVWLARRVTPEVARAVRALRVYGIGLVAEGRRHYPNGSLAAHVLGFVGQEEQGLEGLERHFEPRLSGTPGMAYVLADRHRRPIWSEPNQFVPPRDGQHLLLTIDAVIQAFAEEAIAEACTTYRAESAGAVVLDPRSGAILAMANVPTFDPARYGDYLSEARRNRCVTDPYPPGSTAKPFIAAAALEAGVVNLGQVIHCEHGHWPAYRLHDAGHRYGNLTFEMVVIKSSNIGMAKLGLRLGNARLHAALKRFGFGEPTGVMLPGEAAGLVFPLSRWTKYSTTRVPFGQEFTTTPLQLATAFAAIANGGTVLAPKIVRGVLDSSGRTVVDLSEPEVLGRALDPHTCRTMIDRVLVHVVEEGTGKRCRINGYRVFGKTGTAQGVDPDGSMSHTRYIGSFLAGAPADDPKVVVLVLVNRPDKSLGYYGGTVAAPAARAILAQTLEYLGVPPTEDVPPDRPPALLVGQPSAP